MNKYTHDFLLGLCCLPTIILIYFIGYYFDSIKTASAAAGMATILAFGANKSWNGSVNALMLTTLVGVSLSFILGVMLSQYPVLYISWICFLLYFYTLSSSIDTSLWWILLQCSITFIINGYSPISMSNLASGLTLIIFGGSIQILMISLIRKMNIFKTKNIRTDDFCFF
ncbi:hypothetical protein [Pantoea vagans]|uniref:hypothetical protein n=1 Tax=Pantoea vagans TaxID=470934 RepID=UPI00320A9F85